ncbi:hypothetical protein G6L63_10575 [Agrobacterium vitis]|uniref:hypothetical protein n=1 Tax=Agrobacterium vitis TaxID=373 RepID=UPI000A464D06|nr:hypothetical protein [Agrobacterium vitis]MCF1478242.1 hypothetical protein [Agrobacterium vitis]MUZ99571.1 hypothetical protein [Agrobacterium vitis]MVA32298.1 hypothetical protein [Agrobacterium vitis]NOJ33828.1 hypothetical protein [Agrobacterium vitis]NSZ48353.1 hypothetical protein [Agrobacterium vitis]
MIKVGSIGKNGPFLHGKENEIFCEISKVPLGFASSKQHKSTTFGGNHEVSKIPRQLLKDGSGELFLVAMFLLAPACNAPHRNELSTQQPGNQV